MKKWEYISVRHLILLYAEELNSYGAEGWELVNFCIASNGDFFYIFKRLVNE